VVLTTKHTSCPVLNMSCHTRIVLIMC